MHANEAFDSIAAPLRRRLIAGQRLGAPCRSRAKSAATSQTVLKATHPDGSSTRLVNEGAVSYAWSARVRPTTPALFSDALH